MIVIVLYSMSHQTLESIDTVRELIKKHPTEEHLKPAEIEKITRELAARKEALSSEDEQTLRKLRPAIDAHLKHLKTKTTNRSEEMEKLATVFEALRTQLKQSWLGNVDVAKHLPEGGVKNALVATEDVANEGIKKAVENPGTTTAIVTMGLALLIKPVRDFVKKWWKWIVGLGAGWYFFGDKVKAQFAREPPNREQMEQAKTRAEELSKNGPLSFDELEKKQMDLTKLTQPLQLRHKNRDIQLQFEKKDGKNLLRVGSTKYRMEADVPLFFNKKIKNVNLTELLETAISYPPQKYVQLNANLGLSSNEVLKKTSIQRPVYIDTSELKKTAAALTDAQEEKRKPSHNIEITYWWVPPPLMGAPTNDRLSPEGKQMERKTVHVRCFPEA